MAAVRGGDLFVVALVAESVVAVGVELNQNDSAAKIAAGLHEHCGRLAAACLSIVYTALFVIYLATLYDLLR